MLFSANNISKHYGSHFVLDNVSLSVQQGEVIGLLGTSGVGKTTLFQILAGIELPDTGQISLNEKIITGTTGHIGYMMQKDLLFPFKTILNNVSLPLVLRGNSKKEARKQALPLLIEFGLSDYANQYPPSLSGGMRQRAALLRTYLFSSELLLLDEPFSSLDTITKSNMHQWFLTMVSQFNLSAIFITHDIDEALALSDRIYILSGSPATIRKEILVPFPKPPLETIGLEEPFLSIKRTIYQLL